MAILGSYVLSDNIVAVLEQPISISALIKKVFGESHYYALR
jgi:hypothetical protein